MQPMQVSKLTVTTLSSGAWGSVVRVMQSGTGQTATQYSQPRPKQLYGSTTASILGSRLRALLACGCGTGSFSYSFGSFPGGGAGILVPPDEFGCQASIPRRVH